MDEEFGTMKKKTRASWLEVTVGPIWVALAGAWAVSAALTSMQSVL